MKLVEDLLKKANLTPYSASPLLLKKYGISVTTLTVSNYKKKKHCNPRWDVVLALAQEAWVGDAELLRAARKQFLEDKK